MILFILVFAIVKIFQERLSGNDRNLHKICTNLLSLIHTRSSSVQLPKFSGIEIGSRKYGPGLLPFLTFLGLSVYADIIRFFSIFSPPVAHSKNYINRTCGRFSTTLNIYICTVIITLLLNLQ